jgi:hypothetical protein
MERSDLVGALQSGIGFRLDGFHVEHELNDFRDLGAARPVQAVAITNVMVLTEIGG